MSADAEMEADGEAGFRTCLVSVARRMTITEWLAESDDDVDNSRQTHEPGTTPVPQGDTLGVIHIRYPLEFDRPSSL